MEKTKDKDTKEGESKDKISLSEFELLNTVGTGKYISVYFKI